jgi:hypothetical protein
MDKIYIFEYCDSVYEGPLYISHHKTKKGAYKEMKKYVLEEFNRSRWGSRKYRMTFGRDIFGRRERWKIREITLEE